MKGKLTAIVLLAGATAAYSQGQISMNDYSQFFAIQLFTSSYLAASTVEVGYGGWVGTEQQGNTANDSNGGSTTYNGTPLGAGYSIELLAAPGAGDSLSSLIPVFGTTISSWISTGGGGYWNAEGLVATIPGTTTTATVAIAAWDSSDFASLAAAQASGEANAWGISDAVTTSLGYGQMPPPFLPAGLTSFSLVGIIPEPSTIALEVIGASAFLVRLRRKQK